MTLRKEIDELPKKWGKSAGKILANHAKDIRGVMALTKSQCADELRTEINKHHLGSIGDEIIDNLIKKWRG